MAFIVWWRGKFGADPSPDDPKAREWSEAFDAGWDAGYNEGASEAQEWIEG